VLKGYGIKYAMSINLRRGDENIFDISAWISQSEAARLRGVTRAAISALVKRNRLKTLKIGGKNLLNRADIENYQPQPRGPKPKVRHKEVESTPLPDPRASTAKQSESSISSKKNERVNRLRILTEKSQQSVKPGDWISQAEAARIRGVSQPAIVNLIRRGRLTTVNMAGRTVVLRSEVENFIAQPKGGRPSKQVVSKKSAKDKPSKK
jgi:excisionase family DNA binding protein